MPWSVKAQALIEQQYAPVGAAAQVGLSHAADLLDAALARGVDMAALAARVAGRRARAEAYRQAYNQYVWPVAGPADLRVAPFHLLVLETEPTDPRL